MKHTSSLKRNICKNILLAWMVINLFSCSQYQISKSPGIKESRTWIVMPLENNSNQPLASEKVEAILGASLFSLGVDVHMYPKSRATDLVSILDNQTRKIKADEWLVTQEATYVITGSVNEWQYKNGLDGEPAVGITLELIDKISKISLWKSNGSRSGWGRESLTGAGQIVIEELLDGLNIPDEQ